MTILKTIDGDEIDTNQIPKGYGEFTKYIQANYDKKWGTGSTGATKFNVRLNAVKNCTVYLDIEVMAQTQAEAERKALEEARKRYDWDWEDSINCDIDDIQVEECEEIEEEE